MAIAPIGAGSVTPAGSAVSQAPEAQPAKASFARVIENVLRDANTQQAQADRAVHDLAVGNTDNVHEVMLALVKAELSFRTVLEVRNRLTEAYQEIMRMQI
jgi:flagellar hook-basal body complex protein FliE